MGNSESAEMPKPLHQETSNVKIVLGSEKGNERAEACEEILTTLFDECLLTVAPFPRAYSNPPIPNQALTMATTFTRTWAAAFA